MKGEKLNIKLNKIIMKKTLLLIIIPFINFAQISVTNEAPFNTEEYLINNVLLGDNFNTSNFSSIGMENSIGHFNGSNSNIGFNEGVVLCTGGLTVLSDESDLTMGGSGVSGEPDLELALNNINLNWDVNNVTTIEFDFIADAETIKFQYVFSSLFTSGI